MGTTKLRIIHLTDLHLWVERKRAPGRRTVARSVADMDSRVRWLLDARDRGLLSGFVASLLDGFNLSVAPKVDWMEQQIDALLNKDSAVPTALVMTGDVSALGATVLQTSPRQYEFPELLFWDDLAADWRSEERPVLSLFGNHDVWPGALPILRPARWSAEAYQALRSTQTETMSLEQTYPRVQHWQLGEFCVEFLLLDTVWPEWVQNTLSLGALHSDDLLENQLYPLSKSRNPLDELRALCRNSPAQNAEKTVRIVLCHHPLHFFGMKSPTQYLTDGPVYNAERATETLRDLGVSLVLAGHRHRVDPAQGGTVPEQSPLPSGVLQLTADTPTQIRGLDEDGDETPNPTSFSVYELELDLEDRNAGLVVKRALVEWGGDVGTSAPILSWNAVWTGMRW